MALLLVGLGNVGQAYQYTRHNIGFLILDQLAGRQGAAFKVDRLAEVAMFIDGPTKVYLVKPTTYMNQSGRAMQAWLTKLGLPIEQSLVVVDEAALPFGKFRLRAKGSDGGHNGLKNIAATFNSSQYPRLRVGIGNDFPKGGLAQFVLGHFSAHEKSLLSEKLDQAVDILEAWYQKGLVHAMNQYNKS